MRKTTYDKIKGRLTRTADTTIQQADAVLGQITAIKGYQEGAIEHESRVVVKVTSAAGRTTVKVSVFDKTRRVATPPGRWGVEKFDSDKTAEMVTDLKGVLQSK